MKLAVLIDAENISAALADVLFKEVDVLGDAPIRRIYGDFSNPGLRAWASASPQHGLVAVQQFANASGKNASDIALVIDAMDLLHARSVDGVCLVSSDSDFSRVALRLREGGLMVFGFGNSKTLPSFRNACHRHFQLEAPKAAQQPAPVVSPPPNAAEPAVTKAAQQPAPKISKIVVKPAPKSFAPLAIRAMSDLPTTNGWIDLGRIGTGLRAVDPGFDNRTYGRAKLLDLFTECGAFDVRSLNSGHKQVRVKPVSLPTQ